MLIMYECDTQAMNSDSQKVIHSSQLNGLNGIILVNCVTAIAKTAVKIADSIIVFL